MPDLFRDRWLRHLHWFLQGTGADEVTIAGGILRRGPLSSAALFVACFSSSLDIGSLVDEIGGLDQNSHRDEAGVDVALATADFPIDVGELGGLVVADLEEVVGDGLAAALGGVPGD